MTDNVFPNIELTLDQIKADVSAIIAEHGPDYVYKPQTPGEDRDGLLCQYVEGGQPSCIVGHVLAKYLTPDQLTWLEDYGDYNTAGVPSLDFLAMDELAYAYLGKLQARQDRGDCWGHAEAEAQQEVLDVAAGRKGNIYLP